MSANNLPLQRTSFIGREREIDEIKHGTDVAANCLNPGFNVTGLGRELSFAATPEKILTLLHVGDPARGAGPIVRMATNPSFAGRSGGYYSVQNAKQDQPVSTADDAVLQAELWSHTERLLDGQTDRQMSTTICTFLSRSSSQAESGWERKSWRQDATPSLRKTFRRW